jgi:hypothetical protein
VVENEGWAEGIMERAGLVVGWIKVVGDPLLDVA